MALGVKRDSWRKLRIYLGVRPWIVFTASIYPQNDHHAVLSGESSNPIAWERTLFSQVCSPSLTRSGSHQEWSTKKLRLQTQWTSAKFLVTYSRHPFFSPSSHPSDHVSPSQGTSNILLFSSLSSSTGFPQPPILPPSSHLMEKMVFASIQFVACLNFVNLDLAFVRGSCPLASWEETLHKSPICWEQ